MTLLKSRNLYKLIVFVFLAFAIIQIKNQLTTLKSYHSEITTLNEKIATLEEQANNVNSNNSRKDNESIARKDLKMYYPNETPYKGY